MLRTVYPKRARPAETFSEDPCGDKIVELPTRRDASGEPALCVGRLLSWSVEEGAEVDYPDNPHGPIAAMSLVAWTLAEAAEIIRDAQPIALSFEAGRLDRPIIMGRIHDPRQLAAEAEPTNADPTTPGAFVDGERISLTGTERVELRCGKASITLTKNGKIVIRGTELTSRSTGPNRIRGGSVELN